MYTLLAKSARRPTGSRPASRPILVAIASCVLGVAQFGPVAVAGSNHASGSRAVHMDPIVGTWEVAVNITNCETGDIIVKSAPALGLFNADGTRHETNATNPALRTPAYGNWNHVRKNKYHFDFKFFRFDGTGANIGSTVVRHDLYLSADRKSYTSEGPAEFLDPAGTLLFVACASATATRFK